jgi:hypothetical protein
MRCSHCGRGPFRGICQQHIRGVLVNPGAWVGDACHHCHNGNYISFAEYQRRQLLNEGDKQLDRLERYRVR